MNNSVLHIRPRVTIVMITVVMFWYDIALCQWATLDPNNEFTYSFVAQAFPNTFGRAIHAEFDNDEVVIDGKYYRKLTYRIKPSLEIPYAIRDYLYREEGDKIFRRLGDVEELLIDYDAQVGDKFLNDTWVVMQIGTLDDNRKTVILDSPLGFRRCIEGIGCDFPFFIDVSNLINVPLLAKMINYEKEHEYYNEIIYQKSDIRYIDANNLWKYDVPDWINPPTSVYQKILTDTFTINQRHYFKPAYHDVNDRKWVTYDEYLREFAGRVYGLGHNGKESIIYDFNLIVGDSIQDDANGKLKVVKIDTIQTADGKNRKKWTFDKYCGSVKRGSISWVEGIGTTDGEYHVGNFCLTADPISQLVCFLDHNQPLLNLGNCFNDLVNTERYLDHSLVLAPMPVHNYFSIKSEGVSITKYTILNNIGQVISTKEINTMLYEEDVAHLESGIYFIQVQLENQRLISKKLIKQ